MNEQLLVARVLDLTIPCSDDGTKFVRTDRLDRIRSLLADSAYVLMGNSQLAYVFQHHRFQSDRPAILVSNHIDSVYSNHFATIANDEIHGSLDNSACNAIIVELMLRGSLPEQVLVSFTGDEEDESAGADQTIELLADSHEAVFWNLEMAITLDLTEEFYGLHHFTIENCFVESQHGDALLRFAKKRHLRKYLAEMLDTPAFVKNGEPDEAWQYDEYDLNCFSFCLTCRLLGSDMHSPSGVAVRQDSLLGFAETLSSLTHSIHIDLAKKALQRTHKRAAEL